MNWGWEMGGMMIWWWAFWALVVCGLIWLVVAIGTRRTNAEDSAEAILKRRYARGELSRDEFERRLSDLRK